MVKRLSHASFGSTDLQRTVDFYQTHLDCMIAHEFRNLAGELYGVFLYCGNGTFLEFFKEQQPKPQNGLFRHICFEVDDIQKAAARFASTDFQAEVRRGRTDRVLQFFVHDPDGIMLEFQQHDEQSVLRPFVQGLKG